VDISIGWAESVVRLALAIVLGGALGLEREWSRKAAGLRTHMMVSLGAASFTLVALEVYGELVRGSHEIARPDPLRIIEGVIGGIGFLGAGSIIRGAGSIEGLTTAGSLWFVGSVGVAVGTGNYRIAAVAVGMGLVVLQGIGWIERRFATKDDERSKR
jgi:putative Mg2+ transporter-C (MgtC) family protein